MFCEIKNYVMVLRLIDIANGAIAVLMNTFKEVTIGFVGNTDTRGQMLTQ